MSQFAENLKKLPGVSHLAAINLLDADGKVVAEGERKLSDPRYLMGIQPLNDSDPLRYEKRMIDSWVRREFADSTAAR